MVAFKNFLGTGIMYVADERVSEYDALGYIRAESNTKSEEKTEEVAEPIKVEPKKEPEKKVTKKVSKKK